jgi:hypothetical protein
MNFRDNWHLLACKMPSPVALEDILGKMILSGEDITIISFLVGLVTGDDWQNDHGDNSTRYCHKTISRMTMEKTVTRWGQKSVGSMAMESTVARRHQKYKQDDIDGESNIVLPCPSS